MKVIFALICWSFLFVTSIFLCILLPWPPFPYNLLVGMAGGVFLVSRVIEKFMVSVPEITGLLTINLLKKRCLIPYGTGLHFRYPWEQVKEGNYINLRLITQEKEETYPAKSGPELVVKWSFQYIPEVVRLPRYIAVDETTINNGIADVGSSFLGARIAKQDAERSVSEREIIEKDLKEKFEEEVKVDQDKNGFKESLEDLYGVDLVRVSIADIDYGKTYQKVRSSEAVAKKLKEIAKNIQEDNKIADKDAFNAALIINENVTKNIQETEGQGGQALASLLMAMARGGDKK